MAALLNMPDTVTPTGADSKVAEESGRRLVKYLDRSKSTVKVSVQDNGVPGEVVAIPMAAFRLFTDILHAMARGDAVTLIPLHAELTTQQAADLLGVSRPFLVKLLEQEKLAYHKVGTHRRVKFEHLMDFKRAFEEQRRRAIDELIQEGQDLNMG